MTTAHTIPGIVRNGKVEPVGAEPLTEGAQVTIVVPHAAISTELQAEFDAWEKASDEAWAMIDEWERKTQP